MGLPGTGFEPPTGGCPLWTPALIRPAWSSLALVVTGPDHRRRSLPPGARRMHDSDRAVRVTQHGLAHRTERQRGEAAPPPRAHHQELGGGGFFHQYPRGPAVAYPLAYHH